MIPALLLALALTDAAFAGFRAAAGRNPAVHKLEFFLRAMWIGVGIGLVAALLVALWVGVTVWLHAAPRELFAVYLDAGARMLVVYGAYATLVLLALAFWTLPLAEQRTLATVLVLGPFTLLRPIVIVAGGAWAAGSAGPWQVRVGAALAVATQLAVLLVLERIQARDQRRLLRALLDDEQHEP